MKNPYKGLDLYTCIIVLTFLMIFGIVSCNVKNEQPDIPATTVETVPSETAEPPVTTEPVPVVDPIERELMTIVIYQEAGGDLYCDDCRRRVADVVLNRVADPRFPDTIEGVLTQYAQYGMLWKTGIRWPDRADDPDEWHAVDRAYDIAEEVLKGNHSELYGNGYVYQAEFEQGRDGFWCCGTYFGR